MSALLEAAVDYGRRRRPIFPVVGPEKRPLTDHGFKDATVDERTIRRWWRLHPDAGIATPTGPKWFVLDVDDHQALAGLEAAHGPLPPTVEVATPRPGRHLYLLGDVTNSAGALPRGIHVRGRGGYVLLPPSPHELGAYEWRVAPDESPVAPAPAWLLELLVSPANGAGCGEYAPPARALYAGEGRHDHLLDFAIRLARGGITDQRTVEAHLRCEFELSCEQLPPPRRDEFRALARWAAQSDIAARERVWERLNERRPRDGG